MARQALPWVSARIRNHWGGSHDSIDQNIGSTLFRVISWRKTVWMLAGHAQEPVVPGRMIVGMVQNQDLRRAPQATVEVKDQEGTLVGTAVANDAGEFSVEIRDKGTYSISAVQEDFRSEYAIITVGDEAIAPVTLTLSRTNEIALEVVSSLPPIQYKASSETYALSRKDIETLASREQQ